MTNNNDMPGKVWAGYLGGGMTLTRHGKRQQRLYGALIASFAWAMLVTFYAYASTGNCNVKLANFEQKLAPIIQYAQNGLEMQESVITLTENRHD